MRRTRHVLWGPAIGLAALSACSDPFGFDNSRQTPVGGGSVTAPPPTPAPVPPMVPPVVDPPVAPPAAPVLPPGMQPPPAPPSPPTPAGPPSPPGSGPPPIVDPPDPPPPPPPEPNRPEPVCVQAPPGTGADPKKSFGTNRILVNDPLDADVIARGPQSPASRTGGQDRLSSTAMESFTQPDTSFASCFACHDTRSPNANGVPFETDRGSPALLEPKQINVSHVFSGFIRLKNLGLMK
jgi:hypothetical protein